ncbi:oligosaccharide flippase family protein [Sphingobium aromaticiconvertens]|uniref:oligosaccharide flippase family protein n=1 Tax=Sphingobium aromaticiconvertens TaxID=365341 RepID=UPI003015E562
MRSVRSSLAWMGGAQILTVGAQFASQVVLARYLTVHDAGIYALALSVVAILSLVQATGLKALIIREEELSEEVLVTAFTVNALITIGLSLAIFIFGLFGGAFLKERGVGHVLQAMALTPMFAIFYFLPAARMERERQFQRIALISIVSVVAGAAATIIFAIRGYSYMSVPYGQWVAAAMTLILTMIVGARYVAFGLGLRSWRRISHFGLQMLAIAGLNTASSRLSEIVLARLQGLETMGLYFRAASLNSMLWVNLHTLIGRVMLADFSSLHRQGISFRDRYLMGLELTTALLWPVFCGGAILSAPLLQLIFGAKWVPAATALSLLLTASMIQISVSMVWEIFAARNELHILTRIEYIRAGITFLLFVAACFISMEMAAAVRVADALLAVFLYRVHLHRMTDTLPKDFFRIYQRSLILTGLACFPALLLVVFAEHPAQQGVGAIIGVVAAGLALWLAGIYVLRHPLMAQMGRFMPKAVRS